MPPAVTRVQTWRYRPQGESAARAKTSSPASAPPAGDPSAEFADYVRAQLDGPVLRYSHRVALLKEAQRRGVGRFEANLVIASALHAYGMAQEYEMRPTRAWKLPVFTIGVVQSAILFGAWWVLH